MNKENIFYIILILSIIISFYFYFHDYKLTVVDYEFKYGTIKYDKFGDIVAEENPLYLAIAEDGKTCELTVEEWSKLSGIINNGNTVEINCEWLARTNIAFISALISILFVFTLFIMLNENMGVI